MPAKHLALILLSVIALAAATVALGVMTNANPYFAHLAWLVFVPAARLL